MISVMVDDLATRWDTARDQGVQHFRWLTHPEMVQQVCLECLNYHNTVWDVNDPDAPEAPLHPLCACTMEPEWPEGAEIGQDPDGEPIVFHPDPIMQPGEWLAQRLGNMKAERQDELLGPTRGRLLRAGLIDHHQLVSKDKGVRTVRDVLRSAGVTAQQFAELTNEELVRASERRLAERAARRRRRPDELRQPRFRGGA